VSRGGQNWTTTTTLKHLSVGDGTGSAAAPWEPQTPTEGLSKQTWLSYFIGTDFSCGFLRPCEDPEAKEPEVSIPPRRGGAVGQKRTGNLANSPVRPQSGPLPTLPPDPPLFGPRPRDLDPELDVEAAAWETPAHDVADDATMTAARHESAAALSPQEERTQALIAVANAPQAVEKKTEEALTERLRDEDVQDAAPCDVASEHRQADIGANPSASPNRSHDPLSSWVKSVHVLLEPSSLAEDGDSRHKGDNQHNSDRHHKANQDKKDDHNLNNSNRSDSPNEKQNHDNQDINKNNDIKDNHDNHDSHDNDSHHNGESCALRDPLSSWVKSVHVLLEPSSLTSEVIPMSDEVTTTSEEVVADPHVPAIPCWRGRKPTASADWSGLTAVAAAEAALHLCDPELVHLDSALQPLGGTMQVIGCVEAAEALNFDKPVWLRSADGEVSRIDAETSEPWIWNFGAPGLDVAVLCRSGLGPSGVNQDNFSITQALGDRAIYVVCDGHGPYGHLIAFRAVQSLPKFILESLAADEELPERQPIAQLIAAAFRSTNLELYKFANARGLDFADSGASCSLAARRGEQVHVAWLGDCRALVASVSPEDGCSQVDLFSPPHDSSDDKEQDRLVAQGAELHLSTCGDGLRVAAPGREGLPGLTVSRAFGDFSMTPHGLLAHPDLLATDFTHLPGLVLLASSGLCELQNDGGAVLEQLMSEGQLLDEGPQHSLTHFCDSAQQLWLGAHDSAFCDDVTGLLLHWALKPTGGFASQGGHDELCVTRDKGATKAIISGVANGEADVASSGAESLVPANISTPMPEAIQVAPLAAVTPCPANACVSGGVLIPSAALLSAAASDDIDSTRRATRAELFTSFSTDQVAPSSPAVVQPSRIACAPAEGPTIKRRQDSIESAASSQSFAQQPAQCTQAALASSLQPTPEGPRFFQRPRPPCHQQAQTHGKRFIGVSPD